MFRKYTNKDDVQKKPYYTDRFYVTDEIPKEPISRESILKDIEKLEKLVKIEASFCNRDQEIIYVGFKDLRLCLECLKNDCAYEQLIEMSAIDNLKENDEFELFYELLSISQNKRLRVKAKLPKDKQAPSVTSLYRSATWSERECYDMFGIIFEGHEGLRRILMPEDWYGHPLLKTYPLQGDEFAQWYEVDVVYGKEYREIIGKEIRDPAFIQRHDTTRFARLGKEVKKGEAYKETPTEISYNPDRSFLNDKLDVDPKIYKERK